MFNINQIVSSAGWISVYLTCGSRLVSFVGQLSSIHRRRGKCHRSALTREILLRDPSISLSLRLISLFLSPSYTNNYIRASRNSIHLDRFSQISFHWDATHCHGGGGGRKMILALCQFAARGSINCLVERSRELLRASLVGVPFSTSPRPYRFSFSILCALLPPFRRNYARVDAPWEREINVIARVPERTGIVPTRR